MVKREKGQPVDHMTMSRRKEVAGISDNECLAKEQAVDKLRGANERWEQIK